MWTLLLSWLALLPLALFWGAARLRRTPQGPMRSLELGAPVTDPAARRALARQQGWMAIVFGVALIAGPLLAALGDHQ